MGGQVGMGQMASRMGQQMANGGNPGMMDLRYQLPSGQGGQQPGVQTQEYMLPSGQNSQQPGSPGVNQLFQRMAQASGQQGIATGFTQYPGGGYSGGFFEPQKPQQPQGMVSSGAFYGPRNQQQGQQGMLNGMTGGCPPWMPGCQGGGYGGGFAGSMPFFGGSRPTLQAQQPAPQTPPPRGGTTIGYSDVMLKQDIEPLEDGLELVNKLDPVRFNWIGSDSQTTGMIAQQVQEVLPGAVVDMGDGYKGIDGLAVIGALVGAIKTLTTRLEALEAQ